MAGTGTDVGKTVVMAGLARLLALRGVETALMKPVQTGAVRDGAGRLASPDLAFVRSSSFHPPVGEEEEHASPCLFEPACSPHLAARLAGEEIRIARIVESARRMAAPPV